MTRRQQDESHGSDTSLVDFEVLLSGNGDMDSRIESEIAHGRPHLAVSGEADWPISQGLRL